MLPHYLLLLLSAAAVHIVAVPVVFDRADSNSSGPAPASYRQELMMGSRTGQCAYKCSLDASCFGFYYRMLLETVDEVCRFFTVQAYYDVPSWMNSSALVDGPEPLVQCDIFVLDVRKLQIAGCKQSSTYRNMPCDRAINGDTNSDLEAGSCSTTSNNANEWWEAELAAPSLVSHVTIYNRQDCCPERLNQFDLLVDGVTCQQVNLSVPFSVANFTCGAVGSRVRVLSRINPSEYVSFCEFLAFGFLLS